MTDNVSIKKPMQSGTFLEALEWTF